MRVLGIDPGFGRVGFGIVTFENGAEKYEYSECFETSPKDIFIERLHILGQKTKELCAVWKPDVVAVETLFFKNNQKTAMNVAEARGVLIYEARLSNAHMFEYTPLQVKMALTGYGNADKEQVAFMVGKIISLGNRKRIDDELDALAIALTHLAYHRPGKATFPLA